MRVVLAYVIISLLYAAFVLVFPPKYIRRHEVGTPEKRSFDVEIWTEARVR
mgnify:CR=1 FL=1